ncbi:hypothetical protein RSAG8_06466, partial [Rhizoctonia solani AG-8 WAC10335]
MNTLPRSDSDAHSLASDEKKSGSWDARAAGEVVQYDKGVDEAVDLVAGHADDAPVDPEEARRIRAKLDWVILPLLFSLYTRTRSEPELRIDVTLSALLEQTYVIMGTIPSCPQVFAQQSVEYQPHSAYSFQIPYLPIYVFLSSTCFEVGDGPRSHSIPR